MTINKSCSYAYFLKPICVVAILSAIFGCVASTNFYTGRTLGQNKFALAIGADDIILKSTDPSVEISRSTPFVPSIGAAYGLPFRFETGFRYYPTRFLEVSLRDQINPPAFEIFDCSLNLNYAILFQGYSYFKYGLSVSKNISEFEPFVHYSFYQLNSVHENDLSNPFITATIDNFISNIRSIGFGIAIPFKEMKLFPEFDYQYGNMIDHGLWHVGIGFRVYTN